MTAPKKVVKRRVVVRSKTSTSVHSKPPKLPKKPPVTLGPRSYGLTKSGKRHIVIRFYVVEKKGRWFVRDFERGDNRGKENGYGEKENAVQVARRLRDTEGAYARSPF